jgi:tetratricopeptide (TPR) repeat protein
MPVEIDDSTRNPQPEAVETTSEAAGARLEELQRASDYLLRSDTMRHGGLWGIIWGLIAIVMGFSSMDAAPINAVLGILGIFLVLEGLWIAFAPTPAGLIADGVAISAVGLWNVFIGFQSPSLFLCLGGWQIFQAYKSFGRYKSFSTLYSNKPSEADLNAVNQTSKSITQMRCQRTPDLIEFQIGRREWKARLLRNSAVIVQASGYVEFLGKAQIRIDRLGNSLVGTSIKVNITTGKKSFNGTISPKSFGRYEAWSGGTNLSSETVEAGMEAPSKASESLAIHNRGVARKAKGDVEGALRDYDEAIRLNPRLAVAFSNRGNTRFERGDLEDALKDYNESIRLNPRDADVYYNRALVYEHLSEPASAIANLRRYLDLRSGSQADDTEAVSEFIRDLQRKL